MDASLGIGSTARFLTEHNAQIGKPFATTVDHLPLILSGLPTAHA
jgi:hypothetical protein